MDFRNLKKCKKYQIVLDQNIFVRYGHMVLGVLRACQKVMENEILRSINPFKRWFFQTKKRIFRKFRVQKWPKYVILSCGIKKRFGGEKGTEYVTPISIVSSFGGHFNMVKFSIFGHLGLFMPFFRGRKSKNACKTSVTRA